MEEQIIERLVGSMDKLAGWVEATESLAGEQVPLIAQEIVVRQAWFALFPAVLSGWLFALVVWHVVSTAKDVRAGRELSDDESGFILGLCALIGLPSLVAFIVYGNRIIEAVFMPRLVIIEYIKDLV